MSSTRKIAYSAISQMIGKVVGIFVSIATIAALFRYLGVEGVGKYTTVFAFVAFFALFADFGLQWTLIRELSVNKDKNKVFKNVFTFRLVLALVVHLIGFAAVWFFNYPYDVKLGVGIVTLAWFFTTMNSTLVGVFLNAYRMDIAVLAEVLGRVATLGLIYWLIKIEASFYVILSSYIVGNAVNFFINLFAVSKYTHVGFAYDPKYIRRIIEQALPIGIAMVFGFVYYKIDSLMLSFMKGMVDVGIYGTPYKLLEVLQYFPSMILGAAFPLITQYAVNRDERIKPAFQKQFDFLALIAVPIVLGTFILATPIIEFIAGSKGSEFTLSSTVTFMGHNMTSVTCLRILIFSVGINFFTALYNYLVISIGKQKSLLYPTIGFAIFNVLLNLSMIPMLSYFGASIATLATEIVVMITTYFISRKYIQIPISFKYFHRIVLCGITMAALAYIMQSFEINILVIVAACVIVYGAAVYVFRAVPRDLIKEILKKESSNENSN